MPVRRRSPGQPNRKLIFMLLIAAVVHVIAVNVY